MQEKLEGYKCNEYLNEHFSQGLFNSGECQVIYSHDQIFLDSEKEFLRIGEVYDDHDLIFGYRKNQIGIWGHYNRHFDGKFQFLSTTLKELCEGWYQGNKSKWYAMSSKVQWSEISNYLKINIQKYGWEGEQIKRFVDHCIKFEKLTNYYIKAYKTKIGITLKNGFSSRSFENMVFVNCEKESNIFTISFKKGFLEIDTKSECYEFSEIEKGIIEIDNWMKNSI